MTDDQLVALVCGSYWVWCIVYLCIIFTGLFQWGAEKFTPRRVLFAALWPVTIPLYILAYPAIRFMRWRRKKKRPAFVDIPGVREMVDRLMEVTLDPQPLMVALKKRAEVYDNGRDWRVPYEPIEGKGEAPTNPLEERIKALEDRLNDMEGRPATSRFLQSVIERYTRIIAEDHGQLCNRVADLEEWQKHYMRGDRLHCPDYDEIKELPPKELAALVAKRIREQQA